MVFQPLGVTHWNLNCRATRNLYPLLGTSGFLEWLYQRFRSCYHDFISGVPEKKEAG